MFCRLFLMVMQHCLVTRLQWFFNDGKNILVKINTSKIKQEINSRKDRNTLTSKLLLKTSENV